MKWKTTLLLGAIILATLFLWHLSEKRHAAYVAKIESEIVVLETSLNQWKKTAEVESQLRQSLSESLGILHEEYTAIDSALSESNSLLQHYKNKPSASQPTSAACADRGPELYREDADFLIKEAGRAEKVLKERNFYYERYEFARKELETLKGAAN